MNVSRKDIYSYVATLFTSVTTNIFRGEAPKSLGGTCATAGFMVLRLNELRDESEFDMEAYGRVRMNVEFYVPSVKTSNAGGVMNTSKFDDAQSAIDAIVSAECNKRNQTYTISRDGILSFDDFYSNSANTFHVYITSFIITI